MDKQESVEYFLELCENQGHTFISLGNIKGMVREAFEDVIKK